MAPVALLLSLLAVDILAVVSPGPAFVAVTQIAARHGSRSGLAAVGGIVASVWIWCTVVLLGLTLLFQAVPWAYGALKLAGGAYLAYVGFCLLRAGKTEAAGAATPPSAGHNFRKGLIVGLTNPKAAIYFSSIFSLFLKPGSPLWVQAAAVCIVTVDTLAWYSLVGVLFSRPVVRRAYGRLKHGLERAAGAAMVAFGVRIAAVPD